MADVWIVKKGPLAGAYFEDHGDIDNLRDRVPIDAYHAIAVMGLRLIPATKAHVEFFRALESGTVPEGFRNEEQAMADMAIYLDAQKQGSGDESNSRRSPEEAEDDARTRRSENFRGDREKARDDPGHGPGEDR
jgi:hypothetical protein